MVKFLTAIQAAKRIGVAEKTVRLWIKSGKLDAHHPAPNRLAIAESDVDRLIRERALYQAEDERPGAAIEVPDLAVMNARIKALEDEIHELQTRLSTLALDRHAPVATQAIEVATIDDSRAPARSQNRLTATNSGLPEGCISVKDFAQIHGVNYRTFSDHVRLGIRGDKAEAEERPKANRPGEKERYLTPDQQRQALDFWRKHGVKFTLPEDDPLRGSVEASHSPYKEL